MSNYIYPITRIYNTLFLEDVGIDGDDPSHVKWIFDHSVERANKYSINGVTYRLTQGE